MIHEKRVHGLICDQWLISCSFSGVLRLQSERERTNAHRAFEGTCGNYRGFAAQRH